MSTPLPTILLTTGSAAPPAGSGINVTLNQPVSGAGNEFNAVLGEAVAAIPGTSGEVSPAVDDVQEVLQQLQSLPQGGKLLPLLRQVLMTAESEGEDPRLLLQQFAQKLETFEQDPDLTSAQALFVALSPMVESQVPLTAAISGSTGLPGNPPSGHRPVRPDLLELVERQLGMTSEGERTSQALPEGQEPDLKLTGLERALTQAANASSQRPAEFDQLMAGLLKRIGTAERLPAAVDSLARPEVPLSSAAAATTAGGQSLATVATGTGLSASLNINVPLEQANWDRALSERVQWMVGQRVQGAHIRLTPENLGPMEIKLSIQNDQASVQFSSAHGVVREALDAAIPRLREMLEASGVELVDVDISGQSFARQDAGGDEQQPLSGPVIDEDVGDLAVVRETPVSALAESGRLDLFV